MEDGQREDRGRASSVRARGAEGWSGCTRCGPSLSGWEYGLDQRRDVVAIRSKPAQVPSGKRMVK